MQLKVGEIVEGTVKSLTKFGAFVALDANTTGLVHISEVAHAYVSDLHEYLTEGQTVKVMVIGLEGGKINLSIKRTLPAPTAADPAPARQLPAASGAAEPAAAVRAAAEIVRRYAQAVHVRVGQQNVLHPRLFRPQDQDQKTITGKRPGAVSRAGARSYL